MKLKFERGYLEKLDRKAMRRIARIEHDQRFTAELQAAIPRLRKRGWLRVIEHSDGNYVLFTPKGEQVLGWR